MAESTKHHVTKAAATPESQTYEASSGRQELCCQGKMNDQEKQNEMKFYTSMPISLKPFYDTELKRYQTEYAHRNMHEAWHHLERAHIIGQKYPYAHSYVHWKMLLFGIKIKSGKEIIGQIPRLLFGGVKSFVGKIPVGNPGGANVPPLKPFPIEKELQDIFLKAGVGIQI